MKKIILHRELAEIIKGNYEQVHALCIEAVTDDLKYAPAYFLLGVIALDHKNFGKALELFLKAETFDTQEAHYPAYRAMTLSILRRSNEARLAVDTAANLNVTTAHLSDMIGVVYTRCGSHERARKHFVTATRRKQNEPNYFFNLAACEQFLGSFDAAEVAYEHTLSLDPKNYRAWSALVSLRKQTSDSNHLPLLIASFDDANSDADAKLHIGHAIAKSYEDLGQYEESLDWLLKAKAEKRVQLPFDRIAAKAIFSAASSNASSSAPSIKRPQVTTPIFIVGLPRTGTTLVDRILSSHGQVISAGELNAFAEQVKTITHTQSDYVLDAETLLAAQDVDIESVGQAYLEYTKPLAKGAPFMVDKMPLNFFYAPLMARAFPNVKIIALRRGAMDSCLSNFRQQFSTQFSYYNYTFDLSDTAYFYRMFDALMADFRQSLPADRFMEVRYEDIVRDQESQTRILLEFCGLPWDEACMDFQNNTAPVSTASSVQVRQPLYSSSIGRWKKYGNRLDGLREALGNLTD